MVKKIKTVAYDNPSPALDLLVGDIFIKNQVFSRRLASGSKWVCGCFAACGYAQFYTGSVLSLKNASHLKE